MKSLASVGLAALAHRHIREGRRPDGPSGRPRQHAAVRRSRPAVRAADRRAICANPGGVRGSSDG